MPGPGPRLALDRLADHAAPLRPGAVVVADLRIAEQVLEDEPGVRGALADAAVGDGGLVLGDAGAAVEGGQLLVRLEGAVLVHGLGPGEVRGAGDVAAALGRLQEARRGQDLAGELCRRAHVHQAARLPVYEAAHVGLEGAQRRLVAAGRLVAGRRDGGLLGRGLALVDIRPLLAAAVHEADVLVAV